MKFLTKVLPIIFISIFLTVGIVFLFTVAKYKKYGIETTATIVSIDYEYDIDGDRDYTVYVEYYVDDYQYVESLSSYNSSMSVGDRITVYYMEDEPSNVKDLKTLQIVGIVLTAVGAFCAIIFAVVGINAKKKQGYY